MKKYLSFVLAVVLVLTLVSCGKSENESTGVKKNSGFEWTREGSFQDENDNYLMIFKPEDEDYKDMWSVTAVIGEDTVGWYIPQEGETLHGDLVSEYVENHKPFVVTISEEGNDGLLLETDTGKQYHFKLMDVPEILATMQIGTEGLGEISYAPEGEEPEFEEDSPCQSAFVNILPDQGNVYVIAARAGADYKFVKWKKNGEDFSTDAKVTVEVTEDVEYIAVFESE